jgi:hypothetical protein
MTKKGKILRDTYSGLGLVTVDGEHFQFGLEGVWRGNKPPVPGMAVQVEFAPDASIISMTPISDAQIANEQSEAVMRVGEQRGGPSGSMAVERFGLPMLIATGLLIIGWFALSAITVQTVFGKLSLTFWQVSGFLSAESPMEAVMSGRGNPSSGLYGLLAIVAIAGPFLRYFSKDRRAPLAGALPLLYMLFVGVVARSSLHSAIVGTLDGPLGEVQRQAQQEMLSAISLGLGTYLSLLVCLYLAAAAAKQFLLAHALSTEEQSSQRAVA